LGGLLGSLGVGRGLLRLVQQILLALRQVGGLLVGRLLARQRLRQPLQLALGLLLRRGEILLVLGSQIVQRLRGGLLGLLAARFLIGRVELGQVVGQLRLLLGQLGQLLVAVALLRGLLGLAGDLVLLALEALDLALRLLFALVERGQLVGQLFERPLRL